MRTLKTKTANHNLNSNRRRAILVSALLCAAGAFAALTRAQTQGTPVVWPQAESVNVTATGSSVAHNGGGYFAQARSQNEITSGAGYFEWVSNAVYCQVGLGSGRDEVPSSSDIEFAFHHDPTSYEVRELGVYKTNGPAAAGDVFRIEIAANGDVLYKKNGAVVYTHTNPPKTYGYYLVFKTSGTAGYGINNATTSGASSAGIKTDFGIYPEPSLPPLPAAGGKFNDPTFGTEILRVTDAADAEVAGTIYSNWHTFSKDNKHILYTAWSPYPGPQGPHLADFDPANFTVTNKRALPLWQGNSGVVQDGMAWSYLDSEKLYTVAEGRKLVSFSLGTGQYQLLADLGALGAPGLDLNANAITTMHMDAHDEMFAFRLQSRTTYAEVGYFAYRRSTNQILFYQPHNDVHHVLIDRSGRYVVAKYSAQSGTVECNIINSTVVDLQAQPITFTDLLDCAPDHSPGGHGDVGTGTIVGAAHISAAITFRSLATPHTYIDTLSWGSAESTRDPRFPVQANFQGAMPLHISMLADDESYSLFEFYACENPTTFVFCNELALIQNTAQPAVRRLLHHRSVYQSYPDSPRATISRDGRFVAFTSNWGNSAGRRDLFIARISSAQDAAWTDLVKATIGSSGGITKTVGSGDWPPASANSVQAITSAGSFECVLNNNGAPSSYVTNVGLNSGTTSTIEYYWAVAAGYAQPYVNGAYKASTGVTTGDKLKITVEGGVVKFYKNAELIYTSDVAPSYPLKAYWSSGVDGVGLSSATFNAN